MSKVISALQIDTGLPSPKECSAEGLSMDHHRHIYKTDTRISAIGPPGTVSSPVRNFCLILDINNQSTSYILQATQYLLLV